MKKPWLLVAWLLVIELLAILLLILATGQTEPSKGNPSWWNRVLVSKQETGYRTKHLPGSGRALLIQDSMRGCTKR